MKELELKARMALDRYERPTGFMWYLKIIKDSGEVLEYLSKEPCSSMSDCYNDFSKWMEIVKNELLQQSSPQLLEHVKDELSKDKQS